MRARGRRQEARGLDLIESPPLRHSQAADFADVRLGFHTRHGRCAQQLLELSALHLDDALGMGQVSTRILG